MHTYDLCPNSQNFLNWKLFPQNILGGVEIKPGPALWIEEYLTGQKAHESLNNAPLSYRLLFWMKKKVRVKELDLFLKTRQMTWQSYKAEIII